MSTSFIHADVFFFVATIALCIIAAALVVALIYAIAILKNVRDITDRAKEIADHAKVEWTDIVADLRRFRASLKEEGVKWKHVVSLVRTFFVRDHAKKAEKRPKSEVKVKS